MDDLARQLASLRDDVTPEWDDTRAERLYAGTVALGRRRKRQAIMLSVAGAVSVGLLALGMGPRVMERWQPRSTPAVVASAPTINGAPAKASAGTPQTPTPTVRLAGGQARRMADGSVVEMLSAQGDIEVVRDGALHVDLRLRTGLARFDVVPSTTRRFVIDAGPVDVAVVGTKFDVERVEDRVRVSVTEGKVRVRGKDGESYLSAGESRWFGAVAPVVPSDVPEAEEVRAHKAVRKEPARASWRSLSQAGDYEAAYRALSQGSLVDDDPLALMDAADAARLSGHPAASVSYLRKVVRDHRHSPVAPLAAFTLGRVLLERMGQPSEAADSFALARTLAPYGSLAQDALAREVEALSKAGSAQQAYQRARQYVQSYPQGQRLRAVKLYGGLD
jgi:transmembrane sensor